MNGVGFDWVNHEVHTEDGYILNVFRLIPDEAVGKTETYNFGEPVFIQHGMSANGSRMIDRLNKDIDSLPIALAKTGYDVWLGNGRGTRFSSEHETMDWEWDEAEYWDFSFPELGTYDLPAALSMVKQETGGKKIRYYGYSLGTTQMFYAMQHPETKKFM